MQSIFDARHCWPFETGLLECGTTKRPCPCHTNEEEEGGTYRKRYMGGSQKHYEGNWREWCTLSDPCGMWQRGSIETQIFRHEDSRTHIYDRFIRDWGMFPNQDQVPLYFFKHIYCEFLLHMHMDYTSMPSTCYGYDRGFVMIILGILASPCFITSSDIIVSIESEHRIPSQANWHVITWCWGKGVDGKFHWTVPSWDYMGSDINYHLHLVIHHYISWMKMCSRHSAQRMWFGMHLDLGMHTSSCRRCTFHNIKMKYIIISYLKYVKYYFS